MLDAIGEPVPAVTRGASSISKAANPLTKYFAAGSFFTTVIKCLTNCFLHSAAPWPLPPPLGTAQVILWAKVNSALRFSGKKNRFEKLRRCCLLVANECAGHPGSAANESTPKFNGRRLRLIRALFNQRDPPAAGGEKVRKPRRSGRGGRRLRSQLITSVTPRDRRRPADASVFFV